MAVRPGWQGGGGGGRDPVESPGARHVRITVPTGFKPGSTLTVNSPGGECSVQVPSGLQEGDSLQVALPHVEQKIAILNAYFGRDDEPHPKSTGPGTLGAGLEHAARSVIDHAAHALGIRDRIHAPISGCDPKLADKVDRCLEHILLDQRKLQESYNIVHWTGYPKSQSAILPAARWRLARRARWLAGRARASIQSHIYA